VISIVNQSVKFCYDWYIKLVRDLRASVTILDRGGKMYCSLSSYNQDFVSADASGFIDMVVSYIRYFEIIRSNGGDFPQWEARVSRGD
jgi:hypothetical protein